jgi:hypothetical protein
VRDKDRMERPTIEKSIMFHGFLK